MRYIVYGAGAVGSLLGGYLARAGKSVLLVGRPAHVARMQATGLTIKNKFGIETIVVEAVDALAEVEPGVDDVIFLCVKSQAAAGALADLQSHFSTRAPLFCWQNGIRNEPLAAANLRRYVRWTGLPRCAVRQGTVTSSTLPEGRWSWVAIRTAPTTARWLSLRTLRPPGLRSPFSSRSWLRNGRS